MYARLASSLGRSRAIQLLAATSALAERVQEYSLLKSPEVHLPEFQVPPGHTSSTWLELLAWKGLCQVMGVGTTADLPQKYSARLATELAVIHSQGFSAYFLIVGDIVGFARRQEIPVGPGRYRTALYCTAVP